MRGENDTGAFRRDADLVFYGTCDGSEGANVEVRQRGIDRTVWFLGY
jgi:hypothetical protein